MKKKCLCLFLHFLPFMVNLKVMYYLPQSNHSILAYLFHSASRDLSLFCSACNISDYFFSALDKIKVRIFLIFSTFQLEELNSRWLFWIGRFLRIPVESVSSKIALSVVLVNQVMQFFDKIISLGPFTNH